MPGKAVTTCCLPGSWSVPIFKLTHVGHHVKQHKEPWDPGVAWEGEHSSVLVLTNLTPARLIWQGSMCALPSRVTDDSRSTQLPQGLASSQGPPKPSHHLGREGEEIEKSLMDCQTVWIKKKHAHTPLRNLETFIYLIVILLYLSEIWD